MASPAKIPYQSFIKIDRNSTTAVYMQIANQFSNAIQRNFIPEGTKLPGTRTIATLLSVNRNTVIAAFEEITTQGWIEMIPNKGCFVLSKKSIRPKTNTDIDYQNIQQYPAKPGYSFQINNILDSPYETNHCDYMFNDGTTDTRISQLGQLSSFYSANLKRKSNRKKLYNIKSEDNYPFKNNMANYLNLSRGLHISKNNILITRNTEMSIYIACRVLLSPGDKVIVAKLSYYSSNMTFQETGAHVLTVPVDEQGIDVQAVEEMCKSHTIRMLYLTPHHHYPTTVTLSAQRRVKLLNLARKYGFIILEDDYDYDFHYDKSPVLPLASVDSDGMVVYIGSFGKSLAPTFEHGFIVAPESVLIEMQKFLRLLDPRGDIIMEQVLNELIEEGEIFRYLKKASKIYKERRDSFAELLQHFFNDDIHFTVPAGGLAIWTEWNIPINLMQLHKQCAKNNLYLPKTLLYQDKKLTGMRLGFGHLTKDEMEVNLDILYRSIHTLKFSK
ncbi:PLP-dependent aminotransferase family protein [Myroides odoratimimus]|uniref:aminotransferase-like domain-containing protein n=1 Tax=Myroides odoratimimus TaxID=76832 RepID=UPI0025772D1C|nr:PLP-dependent aminotransferase family protein [Myroides odoratimimus]MDM1398304.1 PLP-dependent aminotransferase family protein [Myroides odoratimimus]